MRRRTGLGFTLAGAGLVAALAGCAPAASEEPAPTDSGAPVATPTPTTDAPVVPVFRQPARCADLLGAATTARFAAEGRDLLGGPGGVYGGEYFAEDTFEESLGGITCVWGDEDDLASTVVISVTPVSIATRSTIVGDLLGRGLIESEIEGALTYSQIGDEVAAQAQFSVLREDSWVSVLQAIGGEDRFQEATELVDEVTERIYVAE